MVIEQIRKRIKKSKDFTVPYLPPLTSTEEDSFEKKLTWIISSGRSGSSWLVNLLDHPNNVSWIEPFFGTHLGQIGRKKIDPETKKQVSIRIYDRESKRFNYFFSPSHKNNWLPALRKLILARAYSQDQTIEKNVIIKDPTASMSSDIIFECLPNSKLIYLVRDGRDNVDSHMAMHGENTFANLPPFKNKTEKIQQLKEYSYSWCEHQDRNFKVTNNRKSNMQIMIKYEDLRKDTFSEIKKIYNFLQVNVNDDDIRKIIKKNDYDSIPDSRKGQGKFVRSGLVGGWKNNFDEEEQKIMNSIMEDTLTKLGYEV